MDMVFTYDFGEGFWDYEIGYERITDWLIYRFAKEFDIDIKKAQELYKFGWLPDEDLKENFFNEPDLKRFFEQEAYNDYLEARYS